VFSFSFNLDLDLVDKSNSKKFRERKYKIILIKAPPTFLINVTYASTTVVCEFLKPIFVELEWITSNLEGWKDDCFLRVVIGENAEEAVLFFESY